ncbi:MAG: sigma-54 dependent transcriptional regulator [Kiritimatiellae bacterium]|nr:sigma-54 dependent transcriptional regulator [Kiritimatiellia bacterium]
MKDKILIVDDDAGFIDQLKASFYNYLIEGCSSIQQAVKHLSDATYDLILLDLRLNPYSDELNGLAEFEKIAAQAHGTPIVVVTADNRTDTVVTAMKLGASDFLRKSEFDYMGWQNKFKLLIENHRLNRRLSNIESANYAFIGVSAVITNIKKTLEFLSREPRITVLLTGETGTGKEVAARYLHNIGSRKDKPFITVQLTSIQSNLMESALFGHRKGAYTGASYDRAGFFKSADKGVLFLDEIGEVTPEVQVKLLRFLENRTINTVGEDSEVNLDVQIVAATNQNLAELVESGRFRADLYYRLKNFQVDLPPLRHRREDINPLLEYYITKGGYQAGLGLIDADALEALNSYNWPGNVRELRNAVDSMLLKLRLNQKSQIDLSCLPPELWMIKGNQPNSENSKKLLVSDIKSQTAAIELRQIEATLVRNIGNKGKTAKELALSLDQLRYRVKKLALYIDDLEKSFPTIFKCYFKG